MSKLSATRTASSLRYHSAFCLSASCHLIVAPAAGKAQAGTNAGALPPNTMIKIETAIRYFIVVANQKVDPIWNEPVSTGNAGALARYEREARNSYSVKKVEIERAAHSVRARAPALPVFASLPATPLFGQGRADDSVYCRSG